MAALTADRDTPEFASGWGMEHARIGVDSDEFYKGQIIAINAAGKFVPASTAVGLIAVGRCEDRTTTGVGNTKKVRARSGIFPYANSLTTDEITAADVGHECYLVDDQTVAKTSGSNARSVAGVVYDVDAYGVWVAFKFPL